MRSHGKVFEEDFKKSLPLDDENLFYYRFKDGTANWDGQKNENVRFQQKNISDCMIFYKNKLFIIEQKCHKGKSLPFNCIRKNQFEEMYAVKDKKNVFPVLIIFFSDIEECYVIKMSDVVEFKDNSTSKSIPLLFCKEKGFKIDCRKKLTRYQYNLIDFLENFE